jgi:hypothetical protein
LVFLIGSIILIWKTSQGEIVDGNPIVHDIFNVDLNVFSGYRFGIPNQTDPVDVAIKKQFESFVKRELRSFNDVHIVKDNETPTHGIYIQTVNRAFSHNEIIVVITFVEYIDREKYLLAYIPAKTVEKIRDKEPLWQIYHTILESNYIMHHNTKTGDLSKLCKQIIVEFDTDVLEPARAKR